MIREMLDKGMTEDEIVNALVEGGFVTSEIAARELIDIELGRSDGDVVEVKPQENAE